MKKILFVLLVALLLTGCGGYVKIHENVNEQVAKDSLQLMDMILSNVDDGIPIEDLNEQDTELFMRFKDKYVDEEDVLPLVLDQVDKDIISMAAASLVTYAKGASLESDKEIIKENNEYMKKFITTGKAAGE